MATRAKSNSYDTFKEFQGKRYTGMKIGRKHRWKYDAGDWTEKKVTPEKWEFNYAVTKRRAGKAPEGSGAPVGTGYRWYILADQVVTKVDANSYTTEMVGVKYKLAHKRADKESWSASEKAQRKALAKLLREMLDELEAPPAEAPADAPAPAPLADTITAAALEAGEAPKGADGAGGANDANGANGASGAKKAGDGAARASRHARAIPQKRKRGTTHHHPRASGAQRRSNRAARRP